ncbi:hypothetical protein D5086_024386 [Populus alba]|uniref:Uncharacterized protein n=1 Tax=Populus alba TaxID=43335 RepID=A0ACC4B5A5_POPAL
MALAANPFCLSQEQYIISSSSVAKSGLASDGRFHRRQRLHFHGAVLFKFWPNSRKLRYIQSIRSHRHHYGGVIRCSNPLSDWTKKFSSLCSSSSRSMPKAIERLNFVVLSVTNALKERNNLECLKLAGILLCALLVIPSADAVDALKTCTCLLKECRNDAWDGYGGAVVYTRSAVLPESIVPELEKAAKSVGRDFSKFIRTDNTCGPEPPLVERIEKTVEEGEKTIIKEVEEIEEKVEKVGKTELSLFQRLTEGFKEIQKDEENFLKELSKEEMDLLNDLRMEAGEVEKLFGGALPIRKLR